MKKQFLAAVFLLSAAVVAGGATGLIAIDTTVPPRADRSNTSIPQAQPLPPMVRTVVISPAADVQQRQFFGRIRARETVDLALQVGGTLERLIPEEGMRIARGEVIAQLRRGPFERGVARAELHLAQATREAERMRSLAASATAPAARAEDAETARNLAEVALRDARAALDDATLAAPFDGLVAVRLVAEHSSVNPGQPVLRLHDLSEMRVEISVPERLLAGLGDLTAIHFSAALPEREVLLRLVAFQPEAERVGQSFRVTLALPQEAGPPFLPGASLTVIAAVPSGTQGIPVPAAALLAGNDRSAAVLVLEDAAGALRARHHPVTVLATTGAGFLVEGLPEGAEIIAAGAHRLTDGQEVRRFAPLLFAER